MNHENTENSKVHYSLSSNEEGVESSYKTITVTENEGRTIITGCDGWWNSEELQVDLANCESAETSWFLEHCTIYDPVNTKRISASEINFGTLRGQTLMYGDWLCQSGSDAWHFNYNTCKWEVASGTNTLLEVRGTPKGQAPLN